MHEKRGNSVISGQNRKPVSVPSKVVPVPLSITGSVRVPNRVVPVPLVPATQVFDIFA